MAWNAKAQPALIITLQRTGGSFLAYCLSNHPKIFCTRGEPLSERSAWYKATGTSMNALDLVFAQYDYKVAMCKMINDHAFRPEIWEYITGTQGKKREEVKIIWLERKNVVAQAISHEINAGRRMGTIKGHPTHTYISVEVPPIRLNVQQLLKRCTNETNRYSRSREKIKKSRLPCLYLTYKAITGTNNTSEIPKSISRQICEFLGVEYAALGCELHKIHVRPYFETITNWAQVREVLLSTSYAGDVAEIESEAFC